MRNPDRRIMMKKAKKAFQLKLVYIIIALLLLIWGLLFIRSLRAGIINALGIFD
jgi:hypothetical protein